MKQEHEHLYRDLFIESIHWFEMRVVEYERLYRQSGNSIDFKQLTYYQDQLDEERLAYRRYLDEQR